MKAIGVSMLILLALMLLGVSNFQLNEFDIFYKSGSLNIKAKVFIPKSKNLLPGIVYGHDGVSGLSKASVLRCRELALAGYAVVAPSFRGEDGSDGQIEVASGEVEDVLAAKNWLASRPEVDKNRIGLFGTSHGALVSLIASGRDPTLKALVFAYGVANIYSWFDYLKRNNLYANDALDQKIYGNGPKDKPENFLIRNGLNAVINVLAPTLIVQGNKDKIVPFSQALELKEKMLSLGKSVALKTYPNSGHGFLIYREREILRHGPKSVQYKESWAAWQEVLKFLKLKL